MKKINIYLDLEATQYSFEIISIGAITENNEEFYNLIKPKTKITKFITNLTGLNNIDLNQSLDFSKVFDIFWNWIEKIKKEENIKFYTFGDFDIVLLKKAYTRNNKDKRLKYILNHIINIQPIIMRNLKHTNNQLSLLNTVKLITNNQNIKQTHNSLEDAKLLKNILDNIEPNLENIKEYYKYITIKQIKKDYINGNIKNVKLNKYLRKRGNLDNLIFDEIKLFINISPIIDNIKKDYKIIGGKNIICRNNKNLI